MAYVPPHKRRLNTKRTVAPSPDPVSVYICPTYADTAITGWFSVGLPQSVPIETTEQQIRGEQENHIEKPWVYITERVLQDLISCFQVVREERQSEINSGPEDLIRPKLVVRVGKLHFMGIDLDSIGNDAARVIIEVAYKWLKKKYFDTNVSPSYVGNIVDVVAPKIGLEFERTKHVYHVKFSDSSRPEATISCKCRLVEEEKKLELFKVELNQIRHFVNDILCFGKTQDLRLMLSTKRTLKVLTADEEKSIRDVIGAAILDPSAGGGLSWPCGESSSGDRFRVVRIWRTAYNSYGDSSLRLKVRDADRFDFRTSVREVTREITLKLKGITSELLGNTVETDGISDMLKDVMKLLWEHF